jgi:hypothetical protein
MPLSDWIDQYPQVKALLQGEGEALLYGVEPATPAPPASPDTDTCQQCGAPLPTAADPTRVIRPETVARLALMEGDATALAMKRALATAMAREIRRRFQPRDETPHA